MAFAIGHPQMNQETFHSYQTLEYDGLKNHKYTLCSVSYQMIFLWDHKTHPSHYLSYI